MASIYESVTNKIIQLIEERQTLPWQKPWNVMAPSNAVTGRPYRGINRLLLSLYDYDDSRWATYRQIQELGGFVRKGEKATQITFWKFTDQEVDSEKEEKVAPIIKSFAVFNASQCDGLDLLEERKPSFSLEPLESAKKMISAYQDHPIITHGAEQACYFPSADEVLMPTANSFVSAERYFDTLAHELLHSTGSANRLARKGVTEPIFWGSESYAAEELVAQLGASFLCSEFGIDNTVESSASYIDGWLDALNRDKSLIFRSAGQAQKGVDLILGRTLNANQIEP